MSAQPEYEGELPQNAIRVDSYSIGYGSISQLDESGGRSAPALFLGTNDGLGPLLILSVGHGLDLSEQIRQATIASALEYDPKLRELKAEEDRRLAEAERLKHSGRHRLRVLMVFYPAWVLVEIVLASLSSGLRDAGIAIGLTLSLFGLAFLCHQYTLWWLEWRARKAKLKETVPDGE